MVSKAPRMISVVIGSAVVARPARGRGAGLSERGWRERRVFGREARGTGRGYLEWHGVTRVRRARAATGSRAAGARPARARSRRPNAGGAGGPPAGAETAAAPLRRHPRGPP